jgi:hypothetical protein
MDKKFIIERQGKQFVLYEGLLNEAHQEGLCRISTTLLQAPHPDNDNTAIVSAEVETVKGVFSGIGDANGKGDGGMPPGRISYTGDGIAVHWCFTTWSMTTGASLTWPSRPVTKMRAGS